MHGRLFPGCLHLFGRLLPAVGCNVCNRFWVAIDIYMVPSLVA
jgi:hypothetical protein